ncbi:iron-dependent repressor [Archaeoglobales archaeon ex4484_92]|nr:MAG: iron-dependent repressor [Archaeoglobales archaeon ex4484_92]HDN74207.1 metal-dependent transcriptional regulator [Archaeoglobus sp.]
MLRKRSEDYVEAIYKLSERKNFVRVKDICEALHVKPATVSEMLKKLSDEGYVIYRKRAYVELTDKGKELAKFVQRRRETIIKFLRLIGVSSSVAEKDACIIEHILHSETLECLRSFVNFVEKSPTSSPVWLNHFMEFKKSGKHPCERRKCL